MTTPKTPRARAGFTLIELMIVVIIIAALAGMVAPRLIGRSDEARRKIAAGEIANIVTAIKLYRLENDRYPNTAEGLGVLLNPPATTGAAREPYIEGDLQDPWGEPFQYRYPATRGARAFEVYSSGPDREPGNGDDVY